MPPKRRRIPLHYEDCGRSRRRESEKNFHVSLATSLSRALPPKSALSARYQRARGRYLPAYRQPVKRFTSIHWKLIELDGHRVRARVLPTPANPRDERPPTEHRKESCADSEIARPASAVDPRVDRKKGDPPGR